MISTVLLDEFQSAGTVWFDPTLVQMTTVMGSCPGYEAEGHMNETMQRAIDAMRKEHERRGGKLIGHEYLEGLLRAALTELRAAPPCRETIERILAEEW